MGFKRLLILAGSVGLLLTQAPLATAAAPSVTITPWNSTRTIAASADTCAFPIVVHSQGTYRESVYANGRDVTTVSDFHISWTNPASGKSVHSALAGPMVARLHRGRERPEHATRRPAIHRASGHRTVPRRLRCTRVGPPRRAWRAPAPRLSTSVPG